ncbi:hypothetical protein DSO57_1027065 [Entomophthora muscae]|uniref:Uncharacterized protein n=1 Tax=Entomophthora muscae TaxID=34485 RepID=A0ACC2RSX5_9FUNG|nr:hypothetical protein DSO57_1027065 [Entomophthora muscae]
MCPSKKIMDLPLVILCEVFEYLEQADLISLGSASKEQRHIVAPVLFAHMHISHNSIDYFNAVISKKYSELCTTLSINYKFLHYMHSSNMVNLFDCLLNIHSLTLQGYAAPWRDSPTMIKEPSRIPRLSLYNSILDINSILKRLTSLFIYHDGGVSLDMLLSDCPLKKLTFNLDAPDTDIMEKTQLQYPGLELISIFIRYDCRDFPIVFYDFKKKQTLSLGWNKEDRFFSLDFYREDAMETQLAPTETIGDLYTRMLTLLSQNEQEIMKHSLPAIKMFSLANYCNDLLLDYPFLILMQNAKSIYLGARSLKKSPLRNMVYSATQVHLNNVDGSHHLDVSWLFTGNFNMLQMLSIYRLTQPFMGEFQFPRLRSFSVKFISRPNLVKVIQASPNLTSIFCSLAESGWESLMADYPRIRIKRYKDSHLPYLTDKESLMSMFDQHI